MGKIMGNDGGKNGNMIAITNSVFLVFHTGTNSCSSTWRAAVFHVYTFVREREHRWHPLGLSYYSNDYSTGKGVIVEILQFAKATYSSSTFKNWSTIHRMSLGPSVPTMRWAGSEAHTSSISDKPSLWQAGVTFHQATVPSEPVSKSL